ncbi:BID domain-containing T4SS effector [Bartonella tribocorum]|uniref:BepD protein n=1 Tax=Bartonella tribocorum (strain DSM 28219 / CCUG 45778 / CIP 105476 / IBS 506) TaxID=382640 RepID=A9IWP9_BART1|nr:BID domain-containing T4SS effector [Bartonella tribocorum]CAK02017.1 bepD protein [Bartonella tribocorum CIP 105476]CDO49282.1 BepD protein [Bartonella tribocorum]
MKKSHPQPDSQNPETQNPEALYAKVNKPRKRGGPRILSPEEIQANTRRHPPSDYDTPPSQQQTENIYAPQNPSLETAYAPQRPLGNPYDRPGGTPSNGRRASRLADPYAVVNLATGETESEQRINPLYDSPSGSNQDLRPPQRPEHLYAELDFSENGGGSTHKPIEALYAKVNKPHRRGGPRIPSPEEIQSRDAREPNRGQPPRGYDTPPSQQQAESIYAPQDPLQETAYAPQRPLGNPYDRLGGTPSNGRRAKKLAAPYAVVNLATGETESEQRINPLYDSPSGSSQDLRPPASEPEEHLYAEPNFGLNGRSPQKTVESVYAKLGMGAEGGQESQQRTNPIYEGVGRATTPPPRSPKDQLTTSLLTNVSFQENVEEVQKWCEIVYGNRHALNVQLAKVLDDPKNGENILWELAENPEGSARLAGRTVFGIKSPDRRTAEDGFNPLFSAFEKHVHVTQKLHKQFTREQERGQEQERAEGTPENRRRHHHHHHRHHHARGQNQDSPEHSPQRQRQAENKGMSYAM